ncbi:MAG: J domain-containing protein [Anaerolineae bacterium]|nr:J domain-containing protein [Anaerolineae bacterium]
MRRKITYDPQRDYYAILGIPPQASAPRIRQAYRRCVREIHPDLNPERASWATQQLKLVNEAYQVLREPALRQQYDQLREGRATARSPYRRRESSAYRRPAAPPDRPWWQQAAEQTTRSGVSGAGMTARGPHATAPEQALWLRVSVWLRRLHLGGLEATWLTLVGLGRSPYAWLLGMLAAVLSLNVAFIVYALLTPGWRADFPGLFVRVQTHTPSPTLVLPTATPDHLNQTCSDPAVVITKPASGDLVGDTFTVFGTASPPTLWAYTLEIGYLGRILVRGALPARWEVVRAPPPGQRDAEPPVTDAPLTAAPVDLTGRPDGYYVIRLRVVQRYGVELPTCDVVVRR